jgi:predicted ATPase
MRFLHISLENWRNFKKVDVALQKRVFITGPNASGKSNFLDSFRFLQDIAETGGGLQSAVAKRQGLSKIRCLAARRYPSVTLDVQIGDVREPNWQYKIEISQDNLRRAVLKSESVRRDGKVILQRPDEEDRRDPERLTQTHLEQVNSNKAFREVAEFFTSIRYLHVVPQLVREPERSVGKSRDPFGGDFLEQLAKTSKKTLDSRLGRITKALQVAVPQLRELKLDRDVKGTPHLSGLSEHWRPQAGWQNEDQFSDGTLRLLGLLWAVLDGSGPLLLEEPELSLNTAVVRSIPQMFARLTRRTGRQIFVSTHSSDLLGDTGIALDETILLRPGPNGTEATSALNNKQVRDLLDSGLNMAEAVLPVISPANASQLSMFGEG